MELAIKGEEEEEEEEGEALKDDAVFAMRYLHRLKSAEKEREKVLAVLVPLCGVIISFFLGLKKRTVLSI